MCDVWDSTDNCHNLDTKKGQSEVNKPCGLQVSLWVSVLYYCYVPSLYSNFLTILLRNNLCFRFRLRNMFQHITMLHSVPKSLNKALHCTVIYHSAHFFITPRPLVCHSSHALLRIITSFCAERIVILLSLYNLFVTAKVNWSKSTTIYQTLNSIKLEVAEAL